MIKTLITFFAGYAAVLLMGMLFYRFDIFNIHSSNFQFTAAGFIGALLYPVNLYREKREIYFITFMLVFLHFILFRPERTSLFIRDSIFLISIISSVMIYVHLVLPVFKGKFDKLKIFSLALIYGIVNTAAFLLLAAILYVFYDYTHYDFNDLLLMNMKYGVMIGFGLSIGFNFAEFIIKHYVSDNAKHANA